jgi:hypothetical protein
MLDTTRFGRCASGLFRDGRAESAALAGRMRAPMDPWKYQWSSHAAYLGKRGLVRIGASAGPIEGRGQQRYEGVKLTRSST